MSYERIHVACARITYGRWRVVLYLTLALGTLHVRGADELDGSFDRYPPDIAVPWFSVRPPVLLDGGSLSLEFTRPLIYGANVPLSERILGEIPSGSRGHSLYSDDGRPFFDPWCWSTGYFFEMKLAGNPVNIEFLTPQLR